MNVAKSAFTFTCYLLTHALPASALLQVDLNRDFPDQFHRGPAGVERPSGSEQPETLALMKWIREGRFVGSASLHEVCAL